MRRRALVLSGFMASGKSTIGRRAAELAAAEHEDLDARIEQRAGTSIAELFRSRGEAEFRRLEQLELEALLADGRPRVIAVGGGALLARETRLATLERAVVVTLSARPESIAARTAGDASRPLLASSDAAQRIRDLLEQRSRAYAECHAQIDTSDLDVDGAARAAIAVWDRDPIAVAAGSASYVVDVGRGIAGARARELCRGATSALLVSDANVAPLHARAIDLEGLALAESILPPGEPHKNLETVERLWAACRHAGLDRSGVIVALGGGVVTDLAGFCAATWMRGVSFITLPTTLLAMVDASVGGKTGFDFEQAKNAIGAFWQPRGVACDVDFVATEPERGFVSALAEVVKTALIGDRALFERLEAEPERVLARDPDLLLEIVRASVTVKARIVSRDPRESGLRALLNLGHTVGHALEAQADFSRLTHGEAVSLGLVAALAIGVRLGETPPELAERTTRLLARLGLPTQLAQQPLAEAASRLALDKKRRGSALRFVVARDVASVAYIDLPVSALCDQLRALQ